jgi:hypothetical protein
MIEFYNIVIFIGCSYDFHSKLAKATAAVGALRASLFSNRATGIHIKLKEKGQVYISSVSLSFSTEARAGVCAKSSSRN